MKDMLREQMRNELERYDDKEDWGNLLDGLIDCIEAVYGPIEGLVKINCELKHYKPQPGKNISITLEAWNTRDNRYALADLDNAAVMLVGTQMQMPAEEDEIEPTHDADQSTLEHIDPEGVERLNNEQETEEPQQEPEDEPQYI